MIKNEKVDLETLHKNDLALLKALNIPSELEKAATTSKLNKDAAMRSAFTLKEYGLIEIKTNEEETPEITKEGSKFLKELFPEQRVFTAAEKESSISKLSAEEKKIGLAWAIRNKWVKVESGILKPLEKVKKYELHDALKLISLNKKVDKQFLNKLKERGSVEIKITKSFELKLTKKGTEALKKLKSGKVEVGTGVSELTHEMITSGKWKGAKFRKYNVDAPVEMVNHGSVHPITAYTEKIRQIFISMGFEETHGPEIESSFWNFDALFTPQDHPARELQDTFYLTKPGYLEFPNDVAKKVKKVQEEKWKYKWNPDVAEQPVLRTQTTTVSAKTLVEIGKKNKKPGRYFTIDKVYRNETTDYKHLAEFFQVEGIIVWKDANFRDLLGTLKEFYNQLGFEKVRFRPHYFPYTEPSVEIDVWLEEKKEWIELGGAGIFRPEVSVPLWGEYPVLAWGLSLERPMMLELGLKDLRNLYQNDLQWLRRTEIK